jgi:hypothetical protein
MPGELRAILAKKKQPNGAIKFRVVAPASRQSITQGPNAAHVYTATTVVRVNFRQVGQPQHITAPTSFVTVTGKG